MSKVRSEMDHRETKVRSRPGKPNQSKGPKRKVHMNFAHFFEFWCFSLGKQARFTLNFCSGMPLRKVHEPTFLWFGLPGPLLKKGGLVKGWFFSMSETWVPKRGGLKPAGKRQESATFLQRSFFNVALQFSACCSAAFGQNDIRTAEKPMLQCNF